MYIPAVKSSISSSYESASTRSGSLAPCLNMGRISGEPQDHVCLLLLNTESKPTGFIFHPVVTADTSSYKPAMSATCPGRDSVGTRVWETPKVPWVSTRERTKGARCRFTDGSSGSSWDWKHLSARRPSPVARCQWLDCCKGWGRVERTDNQEQPLRRRGSVDAVRAHAIDDWRDEVDVEYGVDVDQVEYYGDCQEAESS